MQGSITDWRKKDFDIATCDQLHLSVVNLCARGSTIPRGSYHLYARIVIDGGLLRLGGVSKLSFVIVGI